MTSRTLSTSRDQEITGVDVCQKDDNSLLGQDISISPLELCEDCLYDVMKGPMLLISNHWRRTRVIVHYRDSK